MSLAVHGAAALTPLGDLAATIAAIAGGAVAGELDPVTGLRLARLTAIPTGARHARMVGPLPALARDAAQRAAAELPAGRGAPRTGVFVGFGGLRAHWDELAPAMAHQQADRARSWERGLARMHPLWMLRYLSNAAHALVAGELGALGDGATFAGPASGASALIAAADAIGDGAIDHAIVVALDDLTADEVAVELAVRRPGVVPGAAVVAIAVGARDGAIRLRAADGIDPDHAEPSAAAIAAVRARLPPAERDVSYAAATGWLGAAAPLVDALIAAQLARAGHGPRSATATVAASPGQIGIVHVEVARSASGPANGAPR